MNRKFRHYKYVIANCTSFLFVKGLMSLSAVFRMEKDKEIIKEVGHGHLLILQWASQDFCNRAYLCFIVLNFELEY